MTELLAFVVLLFAAPAVAQQQPHEHARDSAERAMGFDQQRTVHHFRLEPVGGTIDVTARDASDRESVDEIRMHLRHIAAAFAKGDYDLPVLVHDREPPGAAVLKERRAQMKFTFEETPAGGRVVIRTSDPEAREALHEFLRFQIREHHTGDPLEPR